MSVGGSLEDRIQGSCEQTHYERDDDVDRPTQTPPKRWLKDSNFCPIRDSVCGSVDEIARNSSRKLSK